MAQDSKIQWCDATSNPLKYRDAAGKVVWACAKTSPGCAHCYAETLAKRYGRGGPFNLTVLNALTPFLDDKELRQLLRSPKLAGKRAFVGDMTDVFGEWVLDALLDKLLAVFALRPDVTFQVLTKRADWMARYFGDPDENGATGADTKAERVEGWLEGIAHDLPDAHAAAVARLPAGATFRWPLPNVWLGVSVENRTHGVPRIDALRTVPAAVRFLSVEPLLEDVGRLDLTGIDWVIVGGESGPGARPCRVEWVRSVVRQCKAAGVACFVKQLGQYVVCRNDAFGGWDETQWPQDLDPDRVEDNIHGFREEHQGADVRVRLLDKKGGDIEEWPADLRVREFPGGTR